MKKEYCIATVICIYIYQLLLLCFAGMVRLLTITLSLVLPVLIAARRSDSSLPGQDGALFVYQNDVIVTPDTWLLAMTLELRPYEPHMAAIETEIRQFQKAVRSYAADIQSVNETLGIHFDDNLMPILEHEISQLKSDFDELQARYEEIFQSFPR